jgi:hypothetical protein
VPVNEFPLLSGNITRNVKETVQEKTGNRREDLHRCQEFTAQRPTSLVIGALPSTDNAKLCIHRNTVTSESTLAPANMWSSFTGKCPKKCFKTINNLLQRCQTTYRLHLLRRFVLTKARVKVGENQFRTNYSLSRQGKILKRTDRIEARCNFRIWNCCLSENLFGVG